MIIAMCDQLKVVMQGKRYWYHDFLKDSGVPAAVLSFTAMVVATITNC